MIIDCPRDYRPVLRVLRSLVKGRPSVSVGWIPVLRRHARQRRGSADDRDRGTPHGATHRVTGGGRPPPVPTERSVQISRSTLFRR